MIEKFCDDLHRARVDRQPIEPLTDQTPNLSIEDAYRISLGVLNRRLADGETVIGKKIGLTSRAVQKMLKVDQPDFGFLTDAMVRYTGDALNTRRDLIQPKAEGEIAFRLSRNLNGPGITAAQVLDATDSLAVCFEIVDSRIVDWRIRIQDTVADNASCGLIVLGHTWVLPDSVDLTTCRMVVEHNDKKVATGMGAEALGSPAHCVAWLANTLSDLGTPLRAGEIILSGSLVPLLPVQAGDHLRVSLEGMGEAQVRFV